MKILNGSQAEVIMMETDQENQKVPSNSLSSSYQAITGYTREILARQATIIIGLIGHVAHGKSTLVKAMTGIQTARFKKEKERNITMKLGYANAKIYQCSNPACPRPGCYRSYGSGQPGEFPCERPNCGGRFKIVRHVSFVDCPGHDALMATMLNGAAVMDGAIMVVAANEQFPQAQTSEHLLAAEMLQIKNLLIVQNKVDLVSSEEAALQQQSAIRDYVQGTVAANAPIVPISAQFECNIDVLCDYLVNQIQLPQRDLSSEPQLTIIRSFDINKPGSESRKGGVLGGSVTRGVLREGQLVEIRPGLVSRDQEGNPVAYRPVRTIVGSMLSEKNKLDFAVPGGLIGVGTTIDPQLCQGDRLVGHILGTIGSLPDVYSKLEINCRLLRCLQGDEKAPKIEKIQRHETLLLNVGSQTTPCRVISVTNNVAKVTLQMPICTNIGKKLTISRQFGKAWRLIGQGEILRGLKLEPAF